MLAGLLPRKLILKNNQNFFLHTIKMQAISAALTAEQLLLLTRLGLALSSIRGALAMYKIKSLDKYSDSVLDSSETDKGDFRLVYFLGENEERISEKKFLEIMEGEKITCVKR